MKLHLPKMLFAAVIVASSVAQATITTSNPSSITVTGGETYTSPDDSQTLRLELSDEQKGGYSPSGTDLSYTILGSTNTGSETTKGRYQVGNGANISSLGTLILASGTYKTDSTSESEAFAAGQLWVQGSSNVTISNDIILGASGYIENPTNSTNNQWGGAIRLNNGVLTGKITMVQDAQIVVDASNSTIQGTVSGEGKTLTLSQPNSSNKLTLSGGATLGKLTGNAKVDFAVKSGASDMTYTIGTLATTGLVSVAQNAKLVITDELVITETISNNGTLDLSGANTITVADIAQLDKNVDKSIAVGYSKSNGTTAGDVTTSGNGFKAYSAMAYNLAEGGEIHLPDSLNVTVGQEQFTAIHADNALYFVQNAAEDSYLFATNSAYVLNENETLASSTATSYELADNVTMTWSDVITGEKSIAIAGGGSTSVVTTLNSRMSGDTFTHGNKLKLGSDFHGTLVVNQAEQLTHERGVGVELNSFSTADDATIQLNISKGESYGGGTFKQTIILSNENEEGFKLTGGDYTFKGAVTGKHMWSTENVTLQNASTSIDNVRIDGNKTLTVGADMSLGKVSVKDGTLTISNAELTLGNGESKAKSLSLSNGSIVFGSGATLDVTNSVTLDASAIKLAEKLAFTSAADSVTLMQVSGTDQSLTVNNVDSWSGSTSATFDNLAYTSTMAVENNVLKLFWAKDATQSLEVSSAVLNDTVLTLNIDADLTGVTTLDLTLSDAALAAIEGKTGLVRLEIVGLNNTGDSVTSVSFYGSYTGEAGGGYRVEYIPEPTTATLSLLALCGLAARRRRKH